MNNFHLMSIQRYWVISFIIALYSCDFSQKSDLTETILNDKGNFFYLDIQNIQYKNGSLPIGVFDSGTGGLTVLDAILNYDEYDNATNQPISGGDGTHDFNSESFIYLGDQANMPYGNYSRENKIALLKEHILKDAQFLLGDKYYLNTSDQNPKSDKSPVKAIVVACNTATAYGKSDIEIFLEKTGIDIKVIGVIDAAVRAALTNIGDQKNICIGVMATAGTVSSMGYVSAIKAEANDIAEIEIFQQAGIGLAAAIDGSDDFISGGAKLPRREYKGPSFEHKDAQIDLKILNRYGFNWSDYEMLFEGTENHPSNIQINSIPNYISYHVVSLLEKVRKSGNEKSLAAIILGCTHYPFYTDLFNKKLTDLYNLKENGEYVYRKYMESEIKLIDPAKDVAAELYAYLLEQDLFNNSQIKQSEFYISVPNIFNKTVVVDSAGNFPYDYKYGREAGQIQEYVKRIPFSKKSIPAEIAERLKNTIPFTFEFIRSFNINNEKMQSVPDSEKF